MDRREWQVLDRDWDHIRLYIDLATQYGINGMQFADRIAYGAADVLENADLRDRLQAAMRRCRRHRISSYLWIHELHQIPESILSPERNVDLSRGSPVWEFVRGRYDRLCGLLPELDGVVLTCSETQMPAYAQGVISDMEPAHRITHLVETLARVSRQHGKELVVRSFAHSRTREDWMQRALDAVSEPITVMMKCVPVDWHPFMPINPSIKRVQNHPVLVEMDHGQEFIGQGIVPYPDVGYTHRVMQSLSTEAGVRGFVSRLHRHRNHAYGTPNWVSVAAYARMLECPSTAVRTLWAESAADVYGSDAEALTPILQGLEHAVRKLYFFRGFWGINHSRIPTPDYIYATIAFWNHAKHFEDSVRREEVRGLAERLRHPDADIIAMLVEEKAEGIAEVRGLERELTRIEPHLVPAVRLQFLRAFAHLKAQAAILRPFTEAHFCTLAWVLNREDSSKRRALAALAAFEAEIGRHAQTLAREVYEMDVESQHHHARESLLQMKQILEGQRSIARLEVSEVEYWGGEP